MAGELFNFYGYAGDFTSNNQAEFAAAGVGLEEFIAAGGRQLEVYTNSEFLCNALPEWLAPDPNHQRKRSTSLQPAFVGLQRRIVACATELAHCRFYHVKAHAGDQGNTTADHFARLGSGIDCPHHANAPCNAQCRARRHLDPLRLTDAPAVFLRKFAYNADRSWAAAQQAMATQLTVDGGNTTSSAVPQEADGNRSDSDNGDEPHTDCHATIRRSPNSWRPHRPRSMGSPMVGTQRRKNRRCHGRHRPTGQA